jgi:DNA-binding MarR family transcriptional regulator
MCHTGHVVRKRKAAAPRAVLLPGSPRSRRAAKTAATAASSPAGAAGSTPGSTSGQERPAGPGARPSPSEEHRQDVALYVAAGGDESVQRVATAVHGLSRRLNQWYDRQLADLDITAGEWAVMSTLVRDSEGKGCTPSQLADAANVAPSSMTHRLDRMVQRGLVTRATDPENRVRVRVKLSNRGWELFQTAIRESNMIEADVLACMSRNERHELARLLEVAIAGLDNLAP